MQNPFAQEAKLAEQEKRLNALNILLNSDSKKISITIATIHEFEMRFKYYDAWVESLPLS